ncbi:MAG: hypothetical protein AAF495_14770 [Pseudomonadota bacterium]
MSMLFRLLEVVVAAAVVVVVVGHMMGHAPASDTSGEQKVTLEQAEPVIDEATAAANARDLEFTTNREQILADIKSLEDGGKWQDIQMAAHPWLDMKDAAIEGTFNKARERDLVDKLRKVPSSELENNLELYAALVSLNPDEVRYRQKRDRYEELIAQEFGELDPRLVVAARLCRGTLRAYGNFPTNADIRTRETSSQAQGNGEVDVAMNLIHLPSDGGQPKAYKARCKVLPDRSVEVERFRSF